MSNESIEEWRKRIANDKRNDQTRYTFEDAACAVQIISNAPFEPVLDMMLDAARRGEFLFYKPNSPISCKPEFIKPNERSHEVYWKQVVNLFAKNEPPIYLTSNSSATIESNARVPVTEQQDTAILKWLKDNKHDSEKLPVPPSGKAGIKKYCREALCGKNQQLFSSHSVFNTAWDRLRANKKIVDAK